jgi:hypothetical protein
MERSRKKAHAGCGQETQWEMPYYFKKAARCEISFFQEHFPDLSIPPEQTDVSLYDNQTKQYLYYYETEIDPN